MEKKTSILDLTEDLLKEIHSRLPVKSIAISRCVCKPLLTLLTDPRFIEFHLNRSKLKNPNLMLSNLPSDFTHCFSGFDPNHINPNLLLCIFPAKISETLEESDDEIPFESVILDLSLPETIGSCNGLVCFSDLVSFMSILNPSTREHVQLAPPPHPYHRRKLVNIHMGFGPRHVQGRIHVKIVMAFGFEPVNKDYKVVRIATRNEDRGNYKCIEVMVYTLATNSWRRIDDAPALPCSLNSGNVLVNGVVHWEGHLESQTIDGVLQLHLPIIVSFDLRTEKFGTVPWPDFSERRNAKSSLGVWEGCLATICGYGDGRIVIWTMKDYGVAESWVRVLSLQLPGLGLVLPIVIHNVGDLLVEIFGDMSLLMYDSTNNRWRDLVIPGAPQTFQGLTYIEALTSIASLMGGTRVDGQ